jgi:hypothetical protein
MCGLTITPRPNRVLCIACLQAAWEIDLSTRGGTDFNFQLCHCRSFKPRGHMRREAKNFPEGKVKLSASQAAGWNQDSVLLVFINPFC